MKRQVKNLCNKYNQHMPGKEKLIIDLENGAHPKTYQKYHLKQPVF